MCLFFAETKANTVHGTHSRVNFPNFIRGEESGDNKNSDDPLLSFPPTRILLPSIPSLPLSLSPAPPFPRISETGFNGSIPCSRKRRTGGAGRWRREGRPRWA